MEKVELGWEDIESLVKELSVEVKKYSPEVVIAIGMGGWIPARLLKNYFKAEYYSIQCSHYDENNEKTGHVRIIQDLPNVKIEGRKVLILDEVADSGDTMHKVYEHVSSFNPGQLKTAVLHTKGCSVFTPDITAKHVEDEWLVYPWEKFYK